LNLLRPVGLQWHF